MFIIKHKKIFIGISVVLVVLSLFSIFFFGLKPGIDFKGGAITEVIYENQRPTQSELNKLSSSLSFGNMLFQPAGEKGLIVKSRELTEEEHLLLLEKLSFDNTFVFQEEGFNSIGPSVGKELTRKAIFSIILVSLVIVSFIAYAFRKVSEPVSSWKYGLIAIVALLHDIIIPAGVFAFLSYLFGLEIDTLFVVALLTILGLSVSDTIVIFDRIRENLNDKIHSSKMSFAEIVGESLGQSALRSFFTSLTLFFVLFALIFFGPETTKYFAIVLALGTFFGTYSSIFLASPLLVLVEEIQNKKEKNTQK